MDNNKKAPKDDAEDKALALAEMDPDDDRNDDKPKSAAFNAYMKERVGFTSSELFPEEK